MSIFSKLFSKDKPPTSGDAQGSSKPSVPGEERETMSRSQTKDDEAGSKPAEGASATSGVTPKAPEAGAPATSGVTPRAPAVGATRAPAAGSPAPAAAAPSTRGAAIRPAPTVIVSAASKSAPTAPAPTPEAKPARKRSVRPPAPSAPQSAKTSSIADTFDRLLSDEDLDASFAALDAAPAPTAAGDSGLRSSDVAEIRTLFAQLAANHVRQVRDFMMELRWGEANVEWIDICEPSIVSLRRAAEKLEFKDLADALEHFAETLEYAAREAMGPPSSSAAHARTLEGDMRDAILADYEELAKVLPQAFALDLDRAQREAVILQSLLLQIADVKKTTIDKLYAAGLTTLETMYLAKADDIAATTGMTTALAERIVAHFKTYRERIQAQVRDATRSEERGRIAELAARLRTENEEYERAAEAWTDDASARKKQLRAQRSQTILDIRVVLARLGEVDRIRDLERASFEKKLSLIEAFLEEARERYAAAAATMR
jgi:hypothetical protein